MMCTPIPRLFTVISREVLKLDARVTRRVWQALARHDAPTTRSICFALQQGSQARCLALELPPLMKGALHPHKLVTAVEKVVEVRALSRADANTFEDALLATIDHAGMWG